MVVCGLPGAFEQLQLTEILQCQAAPVIRRTGWFEAAFAVASILVAQHLQPSVFVPTQQVRTQQPFASPVEGGDRLAVNDRGPYMGMSFFQCSDGTRHSFQNTALLKR